MCNLFLVEFDMLVISSCFKGGSIVWPNPPKGEDQAMGWGFGDHSSGYTGIFKTCLTLKFEQPITKYLILCVYLLNIWIYPSHFKIDYIL